MRSSWPAIAAWAPFVIACGLACGGASADAARSPSSSPGLSSAPALAARLVLPPPPEELYGELFVAVQSTHVFDDQKTFVDAVPRLEPRAILEQYEAQKAAAGFDLKTFVAARFTLPVGPIIQPPAGQSLRAHIDWLWPALTRETSVAPRWSSLVPLPERYVVPGGRFREVYYWDSYFTMLGLNESGHPELVRSMLANFAYEIDQLGHIPNGNRTYYLSRSQPPFFSHMVELAAASDASLLVRYLPQLRREHAYWMEGAEALAPGTANERVVALPDGALLNRYWDERDTPRTESYSQDIETAGTAPSAERKRVYRHLRAAAASGWDFSSRWLDDSGKLSSIRTTAILPVDLNSLLFHLERSIAKGCQVQRDSSCVEEFSERARGRAAAIERYLWNGRGYYGDYDWERAQPRDDVTAACLFPLFVGVASAEHAQHTARKVQAELLAPGGLLTTPRKTGQQWDAPNGWAPLQWVAVAGLRRYDEAALAQRIGERFLARVKHVYDAQGKLVEKYDVAGGAAEGGGGEYPNQDGFGWTNGVTLLLIDLYEAKDPGARRPLLR